MVTNSHQLNLPHVTRKLLKVMKRTKNSKSSAAARKPRVAAFFAHTQFLFDCHFIYIHCNLHSTFNSGSRIASYSFVSLQCVKADVKL